MGAGHAHALYVHEHSPLHRMSPQVKLVALVAFVVSAAITPREALWAFGAYAVILLFLIRIARLRIRFVGARLVGILPFVLFAFIIPLIASGERTEILGLSVSVEGMWAAWGILAKATVGASASILLAATTEVPDILRGMTVLRVPPLLISVAGFMIRYIELIADELARMRVAMRSRGYEPRWIWQAGPVAAAAGATFIRSYERGERVYDAMLSRGFTGTMPDPARRRPGTVEWVGAMTVAGLAALVALGAILST